MVLMNHMDIADAISVSVALKGNDGTQDETNHVYVHEIEIKHSSEAGFTARAKMFREHYDFSEDGVLKAIQIYLSRLKDINVSMDQIELEHDNDTKTVQANIRI